MRALKLFSVLCLVASMLAAVPSAAQAPASTSGSLKELLASLWGRLRAATPRASQITASATVTAGLRGEEATESGLTPVWKGLRDDDPKTRAAREALDRAQELADAGKYAPAAKAFEAFAEANPQSPLAPNAQFGGALAHAALGERQRATQDLEAFLKRHPEHPLAEDAKRALAALAEK